MAEAARARYDLPTIEDESRPFWTAAREGQLLIGRCRACTHFFYFPRPFCPKCWSAEVDLQRASGKATLYTYSIVYANDLPPFNERVPYVAAMVDLEEGPRVSTNIVGCEFNQLKIGMALRVDFREIGADVSIPVFRPQE